MGVSLLTSSLGPIHGEGDPSQYRSALAQLAQERETANADASRATQGMAELLPQAIEAGVSVVDAAQITGLSRPTVYRLLSEARERRPLRDVAAQFETALERNDRALPADLANYFGAPIEEVFRALSALYPLLGDDFRALGPSAITDLVKFLPELGVPESIVLAMFLLQAQTREYVAASTQLPATEVLGWAALGLLRVLPRIRAGQAEVPKKGAAATTVDRRYRVGDPRRHRRFDV